MEVVKRTDGYWITGAPDNGADCGPYDTKKEADSDRVGMQRFYRHADDKGFISVEPNREGNARAPVGENS